MTPTREEWRPVVGYEGLYEVSDQGNVRSLDRIARAKGSGTQLIKGRILTPKSRPRDGRRRVGLSAQRDRSQRAVYRLVLEAFVGPCPPNMEACHNDGDASNDRLSNLRWDTKSANGLDAVRHGTHGQRRKTRCPEGHALVAPNLVPAALARAGHRDCLACSRAGSYWRWATKRGEVINRRALGNDYYSEIVRGA